MNILLRLAGVNVNIYPGSVTATVKQKIMEEAKKIACVIIDQNIEELNMLSQSIWNNPELAFNEHYAHNLLTDYLEKCGFQVEKSFTLPTAFKATFCHGDNKNGANIAMLCEYDALPGIGHACGHNLIAEVGIAASVAVKAAMVSTNQIFGKVKLLTHLNITLFSIDTIHHMI